MTSKHVDGPDADDVEGHTVRGKAVVADDQDVEGHAARSGHIAESDEDASRATPPRRSTEQTSRSRPCGVDAHGRLRVTATGLRAAPSWRDPGTRARLVTILLYPRTAMVSPPRPKT